MACAYGIEQDCNECRICSNKDSVKKITNYEKIKGMSIEGLADFLLKIIDPSIVQCMMGEGICKWEDYPTHDKGCKDCFKEWLESECDVE